MEIKRNERSLRLPETLVWNWNRRCWMLCVDSTIAKLSFAQSGTNNSHEYLWHLKDIVQCTFFVHTHFFNPKRRKIKRGGKVCIAVLPMLAGRRKPYYTLLSLLRTTGERKLGYLCMYLHYISSNIHTLRDFLVLLFIDNLCLLKK